MRILSGVFYIIFSFLLAHINYAQSKETSWHFHVICMMYFDHINPCPVSVLFPNIHPCTFMSFPSLRLDFKGNFYELGYQKCRVWIPHWVNEARYEPIKVLSPKLFPILYKIPSLAIHYPLHNSSEMPITLLGK